jgi:hypothetical protein
MSHSGRLLAAGVFVAACGFNTRAHGDIDATGPWLTTIFDVTAISQWVQTGSSLTVDLSNFPPLSSPFSGTIDPVTGMFSIGGSSICPYAGDTMPGMMGDCPCSTPGGSTPGEWRRVVASSPAPPAVGADERVLVARAEPDRVAAARADEHRLAALEGDGDAGLHRTVGVPSLRARVPQAVSHTASRGVTR